MNQRKPNEYYWQLAGKILNGTATPEEQEIFAGWYNQHQDDPVEIPDTFATNSDQLKRRMLTTINNRKQVPKAKYMPMLKYTTAASVVLLMTLFGLYYGRGTGQQAKQHKPETIVDTKTGIVPGANKAILSLADGSRLVLDDTQNGIISNKDGFRITKNDGQLTVDAGKRSGAANTINNITTPKGGQYRIVLADGTAVWLNAASSLDFPTAFSGKERRIQLKGEAYFEVAKDPSKPFVVELNNMNITVLGTHFNVKAYDDENNIWTTLLEGSVKLKKGNNTVFLKPGQEARADSLSAGFQVQDNVDISHAIAWKNGLFEFDAPIKDIMLQIGRWYDVNIVYEGRVTERSFAGTIARKKNIEEVLQLLELTGSIHFKIEGRTVKVMP
jgi:transmembrane sensor